MKMHLETSEQNLISNYGRGVLSVNGQDYHDNILITSRQVIENWFSGDISTLTQAHFEPLFELPETDRPEIVVLGSGEAHVFPDFAVMAALPIR